MCDYDEYPSFSSHYEKIQTGLMTVIYFMVIKLSLHGSFIGTDGIPNEVIPGHASLLNLVDYSLWLHYREAYADIIYVYDINR